MAVETDITRLSLAERIALLPARERERLLAGLGTGGLASLLYEWRFWARPAQVAPEGDWRIWLLLSGRGFGKTRAGAEWVREQVERHGRRRIALVGRTAADVRDVMVEGESGVLAVCPPWNRPEYIPSKRRLEWPNGAIATMYSADQPDLLRGPQHDAAWCDELAAWRYPDAFDMLLLGLRLGDDPRCVVTTTPRPTPVIRRLLADPRVVVTRGSTYENRANLAPEFVAQVVAQYEGTTLGRQEVYGEVIDDVEGALWHRDLLDRTRVAPDAVPPLSRVVVAVDPAVTAGAQSDETGIVVAGVDRSQRLANVYVLADLSGRWSPQGWAERVVAAYREHEADRVVVEVNQGGDLVEAVLRGVDESLPLTKVHASRGKRVRAEPVAALYEQGRVHHVGLFAELEDQLCTWTGDEESPDRLDALVYAVTALAVEPRQRTVVVEPAYRISPL